MSPTPDDDAGGGARSARGSAACQRKMRPAWRSRMPIALRMPIWRVFWTAEMASVEAMPSATATSTKNWIV